MIDVRRLFCMVLAVIYTGQASQWMVTVALSLQNIDDGSELDFVS